ncbi:hypothetical protein LZ480_16005 [Solibacillus sp. MA9]|uniref:YusW-like protein n=1 Tax=Solibacillus palustris TaxID=2908203 RepID=A0ABS9UHH8_9BACL|nr:hypothetical protein [Solibacillus sp. MA9]MCH7323380.1 hypothetical protein [Solibacillus sp. MA9]
MKKWLLVLTTIVLLAACSEKEAKGPTIDKVENVNEDVQSLVDITEDDKFASFIYSETGTSYLLLNATGTVSVEIEPSDNLLNVQITQKDDQTPDEIDDIVYALKLDKAYETIHIFENGKEIEFEVWYE